MYGNDSGQESTSWSRVCGKCEWRTERSEAQAADQHMHQTPPRKGRKQNRCESPDHCEVQAIALDGIVQDRKSSHRLVGQSTSGRE